LAKGYGTPVCRICGKQFETYFMDTVARCPRCGTVYANESPSLENAKILEMGEERRSEKNEA